MEHRSQRWFLDLAVVAFICGPATGAGLALHVAEAGQHHDAEHCAICLDLTIVAGTAELPAPVLIDGGVQAPTRIRPVPVECPVVASPCEPLVARAPPV
jgi:hypothetical protein